MGIPAPEESSRRYPHQFSGGMQQRALIAIALACEPQVLLADEPTTALDVTIQAQIMALLDKINREHGTAIVLVTHNLGLVAEFCENIIVMYAGQMMERGTTDQVIEDPRHPYTRRAAALPAQDRRTPGQIQPIPGLVPDLAELPAGCPFSPRCDEVLPECTRGRTRFRSRTLPDGRHGALPAAIEVRTRRLQRVPDNRWSKRQGIKMHFPIRSSLLVRLLAAPAGSVGQGRGWRGPRRSIPARRWGWWANRLWQDDAGPGADPPVRAYGRPGAVPGPVPRCQGRRPRGHAL